MKLYFALVLMFTSAPTALSQVPSVCPWFTTGSAAMALGGDATVVAHASGNWDGSCKFEHHSEKVVQTIEIVVSKADSHPCPTVSTSLKALGNEAVQCSRTNEQGYQSDTIAGRVRNAYFVVTMTNVPAATREPSGQTRPSDPFEASPLGRVAEQVVGNLF
ncbi:MAG: hypothetical protein WB679_25410 [Terracidiphilus sp.]